MTDTPKRIWLLPDAGNDGETLWCDNPAPGAEMSPEDAVEYVRADLVPGWQPIETAPKLTVSQVGALDPDELPDGPCIVLTGDIGSIKAAAKMWGDVVALVPAPSKGGT